LFVCNFLFLITKKVDVISQKCKVVFVSLEEV